MNTEAIASFRYRLREAAKNALTIGDELLQLSQDAGEPSNEALKELRDLESSLDVALRLRTKDVKKLCANNG